MDSKRSPLALLGRMMMGVLFVGTLWISGVGCDSDDHDRDYDHYRDREMHHYDNDRDYHYEHDRY